MVRKIEMTKDHETKDGQKLKKGDKHSVYKPLYDELVTDLKVAKPTKPTEGERS